MIFDPALKDFGNDENMIKSSIIFQIMHWLSISNNKFLAVREFTKGHVINWALGERSPRS